MRADPAASVMSVFDDLSEAVDEIGEELARDMAEEQDPAGGSEAPEEGMQSLAYAAKRVMSQVEVKITDLQVIHSSQEWSKEEKQKWVAWSIDVHWFPFVVVVPGERAH